MIGELISNSDTWM